MLTSALHSFEKASEYIKSTAQSIDIFRQRVPDHKMSFFKNLFKEVRLNPVPFL